MRVVNLFGLSLFSSLVLISACRIEKSAPPSFTDLQHGGVYVAYNLGCEHGCSQLARGDVILAVDGQPVSTRAQLLAASLTDERPVVLDVLRAGETSPREVTIQAKPHQDFPPLQDVPPFWTVGAEALNRAPEWARELMFSHALPALEFMHVDGGWISGRDLYGHKTIIVVWPDMPIFERHYRNFRDQMSVFYRVLQKAQQDLEAQGVSIVFAVCGPSNDTTVRRELAELGEPLPPLPVYRCAPAWGSGVPGAGDGPGRQVGLEHSGQTFFDYVRGFPVVVVTDEGGIVRWHSAGYYEGPLNTILSAVMFALQSLDEHPGR